MDTFVTPAFAGLRVRAQHVQPGRRRGADRDDRQRVLPRRTLQLDHSRRVAGLRGWADQGRRRSSGRPTPTPSDQAGISRLYGGIHVRGRRPRGSGHRQRVREGCLGQGSGVLRGAGMSETPQSRAAAGGVRWFLGGLLAGGLAGAAAFVLAAAAPLPPRAGRRPVLPRFVEETTSSGIRHVVRRRLQVLRRRRRRHLRLRRRRSPRPLPGRRRGARRRSTTTTARSAASSGSARCPTPPPTSPRSPARTRSTSTPTGTSTWPCCGSARTCCCVGWAAAGSSGPTRRGRSTAARPGRTAFSATWEDPAALPTLAFGNYLDVKADEQNARGCSDSAMYRPAAGGAGYATTDQTGTGAVHAVDPLRRLERHRPARPADGQRPPLLHRRPGAAVASRRRRAPRPYTLEEGWQPLQIWGMGIATYDVTGDGLPEVFLTSQGDNRLQTLTDGPERPTYGDIAIRRGVTAHRPFMGDAAPPFDRVAPGVRRREQRRRHRPVHLQGQRRRPGRPRCRGPQQPAPRQHTRAPSPSAPERPGS